MQLLRKDTFFCPLLICFLIDVLPHLVNTAQEDKEYWRKLTQEDIKESYTKRYITNKAKNVILFLGDGMGISTITTARILKGQLNKKTGEEGYLSFERFPNVGLLKTYNVDRQVADSAASATAFLTGVKGNFGTIGVDSNVKWSDCSTYQHKHDVNSFVMDAVRQGKSVGLVTTTRITHATPAGVYAHTPHRDWESDVDKQRNMVKDVPQHDKTNCLDIAQQLINNAFQFNVIMGGGRKKFLPNTTADPVTPGKTGERLDGKNLLNEWVKRHEARNHKTATAYSSSQLKQLDLNKVDYLLGLVSHDTLLYEEERVQQKVDEPSLTEMVTAALQILKRNSNGYVLFVEGGRIDHGHHSNMARHALMETVSMDDAIAAANSQTSEEDTLLMVTADHSHTLTLGFYPSRGNNILGKADFYHSDNSRLPLDNKAETSLLYANGNMKSAVAKEGRKDVANDDTPALNYVFQSLVPIKYESHGGEDVAVFARGPWAHLIHRTHEQTFVAELARFAACLEPSEYYHCLTTASYAMPLKKIDSVWLTFMVGFCLLLQFGLYE